MSKILGRSDILAASDLKTRTVAVPEWGGDVIVRELTGADRDIFENAMVSTGADGKKTADLTNMRAKLVALSIVGEDGARLFGVDDIVELSGKSAAALDRLFDVAQQLSGIGSAAVEDAGKNSEPAPSASSTSGSL